MDCGARRKSRRRTPDDAHCTTPVQAKAFAAAPPGLAGEIPKPGCPGQCPDHSALYSFPQDIAPWPAQPDMRSLVEPQKKLPAAPKAPSAPSLIPLGTCAMREQPVFFGDCQYFSPV